MPKNSKKVAVFDLDDTLIDLKRALYAAIIEDYPHARHWCLWDNYNIQTELNMTDQEFIDTSVKKKVFKKALPNIFAPYLLKDLSERGFHIIILTAREGFVPDAYNQTKKYLDEHDLYHDELLVSSHGESKMDHLHHHDEIEFAVDDQVKNCDDFAASGKVKHVFLPALKHNADCSRYIRLHNLYQVYPYLGLE